MESMWVMTRNWCLPLCGHNGTSVFVNTLRITEGSQKTVLQWSVYKAAMVSSRIKPGIISSSSEKQ